MELIYFRVLFADIAQKKLRQLGGATSNERFPQIRTDYDVRWQCNSGFFVTFESFSMSI